MTARIHTLVVHRVAVPAWVLAVVLSAVIALALATVISGPSEPVAAPSQAPPSSCLDAVVGHC
jgi:hypothetical protein